MGYEIVEDGYQASHRSPEHLFAQYWFPDGIRVFFDCDTDAVNRSKQPVKLESTSSRLF
jgi:hypothetical protein